MHRLDKIISGGQTGVDQAALRVGLDKGIKIGGWCPPGRVCENGKIPLEYTLIETKNERSEDAPNIPRSQRTENNVKDSDGTLILKPQGLKNDKGTEWTIKCAQKFNKPFVVIDPYVANAEKLIIDWLSNNSSLKILNIAGPSEKTFSGINNQTYNLLLKTFSIPQNKKDNETELEIKSDPVPWYVGLAISLSTKIGNIWNFLFKLILVIISILVLILILNKWFGLRIDGGKLYFGTPITNLGAHVTVDATAGFQNSGIYVHKGDKIQLKPEGRIHIAMDHANNLAKTVKGILINYTDGKKFSDEQKKRYPKQTLDPSFVFYRDWCGPEGDPAKSDLIEECKLRKDLSWGCLLGVIIPSENISAKADPFEVLASNKLTPNDLFPIKNFESITATTDGYLVFIINEAIISPSSSSTDSKEFYETLKKSQQELINDPIHQIPLTSIPLIWYADNNGAFRITVTTND